MTTKNSLILGFFFITTLFVLESCNDKKTSEPENQIQDHKVAQLKNTYENSILILSTEFVTKTMNLKESINNFEQQTNLEILSETQENWKSLVRVWKQLELYNIGAIQESFIHYEINRWETNTRNINNYIDGTDFIDALYVASKGSSSRGISALEYLLFSTNDSQEIMNSFTTAVNSERRLKYLKALAQNLETKAKQLLSIWENNEEVFLNSLESEITGSMNQLTNAMITLLEEIIIGKLGKPLGNDNGGNTNVDVLEAFRSSFSLEIIKEHLTALEQCYSGKFQQDQIDLGYSAYLDLLGNDTLDKIIIAAFTNCKEKANAITNPLNTELTNNTQKVIDLRKAFRDLLILIKVDLASAIGVIITISDNDGDS
jgi:predicted lipoprotein